MAIWTDLAEWRGPTVNEAGPMIEHRGLVIHIAEGGYEGTIAWQHNPAAQVSSHFVVDVDGKIAQVVDADTHTAWTQQAGNGHWLSVENAGFTPHPLTDAQVEANARLLARAHRDYGVPLQVAIHPDGRGLGHHSMGTSAEGWSGPTWGHQDCPGPAIIAQKAAVVARAQQIIDGGSDMALTDKASNGLSVDAILVALYNTVRTDDVRLNYLANKAGLVDKLNQILAAEAANPATTVTMSDADAAALAGRVADLVDAHLASTDAAVAKLTAAEAAGAKAESDALSAPAQG
jgi:hypothetical protein